MIQTEIYNDKSFLCEMHPQQSMKLICYAERCPYKRRFICLQCLLDKKEQENIATLQDFIKDPISILDQYKEYSQPKINNCEELLKQIDDFKFIVQQVQQDILLLLDNLKEQVSNLNKNYLQAQEDILKRLQIHEFQQQLALIWKMDKYEGTKEFAVLEQQLNSIIRCWKDCYQNIVTQHAKQLFDIQQQFSIGIEYKLKLEENFYDNLLKSLSSLFDSQTEIPAFIYKEISRGKNIKYQLIYQGTRDGLSNDNYWLKCNQQSHLLTVIKLKNGNIFGGYSPCELIRDSQNSAADITQQSFIFQQNKQQIYKLKDNSITIYCDKDSGPRFGSDFFVYNDFKSVSSTLGSHYDITGYNVQNANTHLIGDKDIQIVECKVFKITFL